MEHVNKLKHNKNYVILLISRVILFNMDINSNNSNVTSTTGGVVTPEGFNTSGCTASNTQGLGTATPRVVTSLNFSTPTVHHDHGTATRSAVSTWIGSGWSQGQVFTSKFSECRERFVPHWQPGRKRTWPVSAACAVAGALSAPQYRP
jgi:hypothetical protein